MTKRQKNPVDISLYAIVDPNRSLGRPLDLLARDAMSGGATLIQYRDKQSTSRGMYEQALEITEALWGSEVPLIVNDRADIAFAVGAAGVHLGQDDLIPSDARELLGDNAIIGFSVKTVEEAHTAPLDDLDYVFIGGVFDTASKDNPAAIGIEGWKERAAIIRARDPDIPIGAIAGIDENNVADLFAAGVDGVAVISAIFMSDDAEDATRVLRQIIDDARQTRH
ncbi:MAG TPA: thiamine phosphate synthase [Afifellaceae bacterium]|nr:thiamine phosphate synthase [Afifellaceae bacterium]